MTVSPKTERRDYGRIFVSVHVQCAYPSNDVTTGAELRN